jgi:PRTRC genetic system protein E
VFTELMPLLKQRAVIMTLSDVGEGLLRINIIPRKIEGGSDENAALTGPLCVTGTPDELDRELPSQLASFTESILKTATNLEEVKTQHAAAVKALEAENRKKLDEKRKTNGTKIAVPAHSNRAPDLKEGKPVFGSKGSPAAENGSLFDGGDQSNVGTVVEEADNSQGTA